MSSPFLSQMDRKVSGMIKKIGMEADRKNCSAYIVGGMVRDILLKKKNLDIDVVVEANAVSLAKSLSKTFKAKVTIYPKFKTATLTLPNGSRLDLATARKENYLHSGALPVVLHRYCFPSMAPYLPGQSVMASRT